MQSCFIVNHVLIHSKYLTHSHYRLTYLNVVEFGICSSSTVWLAYVVCTYLLVHNYNQSTYGEVCVLIRKCMKFIFETNIAFISKILVIWTSILIFHLMIIICTIFLSNCGTTLIKWTTYLILQFCSKNFTIWYNHTFTHNLAEIVYVCVRMRLAGARSMHQ